MLCVSQMLASTARVQYLERNLFMRQMLVESMRFVG